MGDLADLIRFICNIPEPKKLTPQQWINRTGIVILGIFLCVIGYLKFQEYEEFCIKRNETNKTINLLAVSFSHNDHDIINNWASGKVHDAWGGPLILSSIDNKIKFTSKGPDGELDTNDDLKSEVVSVKPRNSYKPLPKPPEEPEFVKKAKRKAGELVDKVKETVDNGEAEVKGRGWSFQWKWGKSKE